MSRLAPAVHDLVVPEWPAQFAFATVAPTERTAAAQSEAGRLAALHALALAGSDALELPARTGRRPAWPIGFIGSIAHDATLAIAVASRVSTTHAVGIDIERHDALDPRDAAVVLRDDEITFVGTDPSLATLLWSVKESAYKAWCTALDADLDAVDPRDIHVTTDGTVANEVHAVGDLRPRVAPVGALQAGSMRLGDLLVTLAFRTRPVE